MDVQKIKDETITPWGEIGYITFKRSYARRFKDDDPNSKTEELIDVILREIEASDSQLKVGFTEEEKELYLKTRLSLKWSVAGRFLWQLGTKTVKTLGLPSLQNCAFVVVNEPVTPFTWTFDMLMLGSGVGYNIQRQHVYQLPRLKKKINIVRIDSEDSDFIVPDTREGWVKLLGKVLKAHFYKGEGFSYSTQLIRGKGATIKGFGGLASGPEELCEGIEEIHKILNIRANKKLRPVDCLDIMNIIGKIVVSGNVRRSAQIALGDFDDIDFLKAKRWDIGTIPNWRAMSNNSVICDDIERLPQEFWDTYEQGEPYGLINIDLAKSVGRTGETRYPDVEVEGFNPCGEQGLANKETCCLADIFLPNINSYEELIDILPLAYKMCKHSLTLHCHLKDTEEIVHRNFRMGIGIAGYLQVEEEKKLWLKDAYEWLRKYDKKYSEGKGFPISIKLTTMKPGGTLPLLPGVTSGGNCSPAGPYYIRRIRIASNSNLIEVCRKHGYSMEYQKEFDGSDDKTTMVVDFPCSVPENTPVAGSFSWKEQLDTIRRLQREWSDNSVSCTVTYKKEDLPDIKDYLMKHYKDEIKTVSFLLYNDHGFMQAPYETINKERYNEMKSKSKIITSINEVKENSFELAECESGQCPVK